MYILTETGLTVADSLTISSTSQTPANHNSWDVYSAGGNLSAKTMNVTLDNAAWARGIATPVGNSLSIKTDELIFNSTSSQYVRAVEVGSGKLTLGDIHVKGEGLTSLIALKLLKNSTAEVRARCDNESKRHHSGMGH